ncbi:MAG: hypothetical protein JW839_18065 [Candidatus Lokiarchaeota archaeon]|nr:hypothetical protein [Candidatus Lokiarchaeota archaeon]
MAPTFPRDASGIDGVSIVSIWIGWGSKEGALTLHEAQCQGQKMKALLQEVLDRARDPPLDSPTMDAFGISQAWLDETVADVMPTHGPPSPEQTALFAKAFTDVDVVSRALTACFNARWSDDFPMIRCTIHFKNGDEVAIKSESQSPFMLPVEVSIGGEGRVTFDPGLARAISAILPDGFLNKDRLGGSLFSNDLKNHVMHAIETRWDILECERKLGDQIVPVKEAFRISSARIVGLYRLGRGSEWGLIARLGRPDWPSQVVLDAFIGYNNGKLAPTRPLLQDAPIHVARVLGLRWLVEFLSKRPEATLTVHFSQDKSVEDEQFELFRDACAKANKPRVASLVAASLPDATHFTIAEGSQSLSSWFLLTDGRAVLWKFAGESVIGWQGAGIQRGTGHNVCCAVVSQAGQVEGDP